MEKDDEYLHTFFTYLSQLCFEKSKEHLVIIKHAKIFFYVIKLFAG